MTVEELFAYIFEIYKKFGYKDSSILASFDSVSVATYAEWLVLIGYPLIEGEEKKSAQTVLGLEAIS